MVQTKPEEYAQYTRRPCQLVLIRMSLKDWLDSITMLIRSPRGGLLQLHHIYIRAAANTASAPPANSDPPLSIAAAFVVTMGTVLVVGEPAPPAPVEVALPLPLPPVEPAPPPVLLVPLGPPLETSLKLAQVRRVVFMLWMTMDLSPKKYGLPDVVDRYASL